MSNSISAIKSAQIHDLSQRQPAVMIHDHLNNAHVVDVATLRGIANGRYPAANLGEDLLRAIVADYLSQIVIQ